MMGMMETGINGGMMVDNSMGMENYLLLGQNGEKRRKLDGTEEDGSPQVTAITFLIENETAGAIIGKQASQLKAIREATGARATVEKEKLPPHDDRVLQIEASTVPVMLAGIDACLEIMFTAKPALAKLTVLLPPSDIGRLVGKGGANINRIRQESNAEIKMHKQTELIGNKYGYCVATGSAQAMSAAVKLIAAFLFDLFNKDDALASSQRAAMANGVGLDPAAAAAMAMQQQMYGAQGGCGGAGAGGGLNAAQAQAAQMQMMARGGMSPQMMGGVMPMMVGGGAMGPAPPLPRGSGGNKVLLELTVPKAMFGLVVGRGGRLINQTRGEVPTVEIKATDTDERMQPDTGLPLATVTVTGPREHAWNAAERLARHFFAGNEDDTPPTTTTLEIPRAAVGKIVGRKGARINAIREACRASVKVVTPEDLAIPTASIMIEGTARQTAAARMLIESTESELNADGADGTDASAAPPPPPDAAAAAAAAGGQPLMMAS